MSSVLRRWAKAAFTRLKIASRSPSTGGLSRRVSRTTAEVTLGAGRKQSGGTSNKSSQPAWYWQNREKAPQSELPGAAQIRRATSRWIITVTDRKHPASNSLVITGVVML